MNVKDMAEDKLNLFTDLQLDIDEMNEIHKLILDDKAST